MRPVFLRWNIRSRATEREKGGKRGQRESPIVKSFGFLHLEEEGLMTIPFVFLSHLFSWDCHRLRSREAA